MNVLMSSGGEFNLSEYLLHHVMDSPVSWGWVEAVGVNGQSLARFGITTHVVMLWIASALTILTFMHFSRRVALVPEGKVGGVLDGVICFLYDEVIKPYLHDDARKYAPYILTLFFFILYCNLIGLFPASATATGNINVTATLAILTFLVVHLFGMWGQGFRKYWVGIVPHSLLTLPMLPIAVLLFAIEMISHVTRTIALSVRLFANMVAGHMVLFSFVGLIFLFKNAWVGVGSIPMVIGLTFMELFVALLQAYVFTMLTALFIGMGLHPDH